jgi:hypothetical protein
MKNNVTHTFSPSIPRVWTRALICAVVLAIVVVPALFVLSLRSDQEIPTVLVASASGSSAAREGEQALGSAPAAVPERGPELSAARASNTEESISYAFSYSGSYSSYRVYIDADQQPRTGQRVVATMGADYLLEGEQLFAYDPGAGDEPWRLLKTIDYANSAELAQWSLSRADLGETDACNEAANVLFQAQGDRLSTSKVMLQRYLTSSSCSQEVRAKLAIPAYFEPGPLWDQLGEGAPAVGIVVINPANGPGASKRQAYV